MADPAPPVSRPSPHHPDPVSLLIYLTTPLPSDEILTKIRIPIPLPRRERRAELDRQKFWECKYFQRIIGRE